MISVVFPSGPVKVFDFLSFFLSPPLPPRTLLVFCNGGISRAHTQSAGGAPLTPFGSCDYEQRMVEVIVPESIAFTAAVVLAVCRWNSAFGFVFFF